MQFKNSTMQTIAFCLLGFFGLIILINGLSIKHNFLNTFYGIKDFNAYNSGDYQLNSREGFTGEKHIKDDSIDECLKRKVTATTDELGGENGCSDVKKILQEVKKSCCLEGAKCMMNLLSNNKSSKTINLDNILGDKDNEEGQKYRQYTELSQSLQNIIDNI